jgi:hypothetical protein
MKIRYSKLKSTSRLLESQSGGDESNPQHLQDLIDNAVSSGHSKADIEVGYEDDAVVEGWLAEQTESAKTYSDHRATAYASLQEQADMQYWDSINGTTVWQDHIAEIKAKHPKE